MLEIKSPITGERLQVAENDFENEMTWYMAKNACAELENGWRLPTIEELKVMYEQLHKKGEGNFKDVGYWSSMEYSGFSGRQAWLLRFFDGIANTYRKTDTGGERDEIFFLFHVRAVRALPQGISATSNTDITETTKHDLSQSTIISNNTENTSRNLPKSNSATSKKSVRDIDSYIELNNNKNLKKTKNLPKNTTIDSKNKILGIFNALQEKKQEKPVSNERKSETGLKVSLNGKDITIGSLVRYVDDINCYPGYDHVKKPTVGNLYEVRGFSDKNGFLLEEVKNRNVEWVNENGDYDGESEPGFAVWRFEPM
jgi:hypothetical protein